MVTPIGFAEFTIVLQNADDPEPWNCVIGGETDLAAGSASDACNVVFTAWATYWHDLLATNTSLVEVVGRFGSDGDDIIATSTLPPVNGGSSAAKLPQNSALLVRKVTGLGGRANRGRMFIPNLLSESTVNNVGILDPAQVVALQTRANNFLAALDAGGVPDQPRATMHILHSSPLRAPTLVTALNVDNVIATQRRRLRR